MAKIFASLEPNSFHLSLNPRADDGFELFHLELSHVLMGHTLLLGIANQGVCHGMF